jgi:hypothetical protein
MTPLELQNKTRELDRLIDNMLAAITTLGDEAHRSALRAACECIKPLMEKRFSVGNLKYIEQVDSWACGKIDGVKCYDDCHIAVSRLCMSVEDKSYLCGVFHIALYDGPDDDEFNAEIPRFCAVIRRYFPESVEAMELQND